MIIKNESNKKSGRICSRKKEGILPFFKARSGDPKESVAAGSSSLAPDEETKIYIKQTINFWIHFLKKNTSL